MRYQQWKKKDAGEVKIKMGGLELEPGELFFLAPSLENGTNLYSRRHTRTVPAAPPNQGVLQQKNGKRYDWR